MTEVYFNTEDTINETDKTLLLGAYQDNIGTKGRFFTGTIHKFKLIKGNMSNEDCLNWINLE